MEFSRPRGAAPNASREGRLRLARRRRPSSASPGCVRPVGGGRGGYPVLPAEGRMASVARRPWSPGARRRGLANPALRAELRAVPHLPPIPTGLSPMLQDFTIELFQPRVGEAFRVIVNDDWEMVARLSEVSIWGHEEAKTRQRHPFSLIFHADAVIPQA